MKKKRLIPVLLLRNGWLVQSKKFERYQNIGNPISSVKRFSEWASDELIYIDISRGEQYDVRREDLAHPNRSDLLNIIEDVSKVTFMPITIGGRIRSIYDIELRLARGADKVTINTAALKNPKFIELAAKEFGSQCIVVSIDSKRLDGKTLVMSNGGKELTHWCPKDWAQKATEMGAGEILINSVDRDGLKSGYDIDLINDVAESVRVPVIAMGGVGEWAHFAEALSKTAVDGVAAANIFQYSDQSVYLARKYLYDNGFAVRSPNLFSID